MNNPSPPLSSPHSLLSHSFPLSPFMHVDRQKAAGPVGGACLTKPTYRLSSSATFLYGTGDSAGQIWSKICLRNLIRQFSRSLLLGRCGPGELGQRMADSRRHSYRFTAVGERETLKVAGLKSMLNFASNETPAFLLASKRAS